MYTYDRFMLMYSRNQHNIIIILQIKINKFFFFKKRNDQTRKL